MDRLLPLAVEHHRQGNLEQADQICGHIVQQMPAFADALYMRAVIAHQRGQHRDALDHINKALTLDASNPGYHNLAGISHYHLGRGDDAIASYHEAIRLSPEVPDHYSNLSLALIDAGQLPEAEAACRAALRLKPDYAEAYLNLGKVLGYRGRIDEAIACFQSALVLNSHLLDARRNLGHALQELGDFAAAEREYREVLRLHPRDTHAYYGLSKIKRHRLADEPDRLEMEAMLTDPHLSASERSYLHFGLGKMCDDCGQYDQAFLHYEQANELMGRVFDREAHAGFTRRLKSTFSRQFFESFRDRGDDSELPVFIVGMPRSATTLVEQIIASHPSAAGAGELLDIEEMVIGLSGAASATPYPECVSELQPQRVQSLAQGYLERRRTQAPGALRITDKMPWNFLNLGMIALLFPNARIIHCRRDPLDVCLSCYFTRFSAALPFAWNLGDLGYYYRHYENLMDHWRTALPLRMIEVDYEDLVCHQETATRRIIEFCGLPWDARCLNYHETKRPIHTASNWQVRQPLYRQAIGRWHNYSRHLQPLLAALQETQVDPPSADRTIEAAGVDPWTSHVVHFGTGTL